MADRLGELGDVATKLLFENERVKIWEMRLAPGEQGPLPGAMFTSKVRCVKS